MRGTEKEGKSRRRRTIEQRFGFQISSSVVKQTKRNAINKTNEQQASKKTSQRGSQAKRNEKQGKEKERRDRT
jgi:hypothetical protein